MNETRGESTIVWGFATFHASAFVLVALFLQYRTGGLGLTLQQLNTELGLGLFVALWATTFIATRNALRGLDIARPMAIDTSLFIWRALRWGALNGFMFLAVLAVVAGGGYVLTHLGDFLQAVTGPTVLQSTAILAGGVVVASGVAMAVGGGIGLIFSGVDLILLGLAARLVRIRT